MTPDQIDALDQQIIDLTAARDRIAAKYAKVRAEQDRERAFEEALIARLDRELAELAQRRAELVERPEPSG